MNILTNEKHTIPTKTFFFVSTKLYLMVECTKSLKQSNQFFREKKRRNLVINIMIFLIITFIKEQKDLIIEYHFQRKCWCVNIPARRKNPTKIKETEKMKRILTSSTTFAYWTDSTNPTVVRSSKSIIIIMRKLTLSAKQMTNYIDNLFNFF